MSVNEKMTAIADKIREKTGGTEKLNLDQMATSVDEVYEKGKKAEYDEFWDRFQNFGNRTNYTVAFAQSAFEYIRPKYKIKPTAALGITQTFIHCKKLKKIEAEYFDFSSVPFGTNLSNGFYYTFGCCSELEEIEDVGLIPTCSYAYTFLECTKLRTIAKVGFAENTLLTHTFNTCPALENLTIEGTIGQNGLNLQWSTRLTYESLRSIINCLQDKSTDTSGTTWVVTVGSENLAKLTADDLTEINMKGWYFK